MERCSGRRWGLFSGLAVAGLLAGSLSTLGQGDPASVVEPQGAPVSASARPAMTFDVVSIKLDRGGVESAAIESQPGSDGISVRNLALEWVVDFAYDFERPELVTGLPDWAKTDKYDIVAKVSGENVAAFRKLDFDERRAMMQALLEDRFQLKVHREPKEIAVYALTVGKNGAKMRLAKAGEAYADGVKLPNGSAAGPGTLTPTGAGQCVGQSASMAQLAFMLNRLRLGREVVDETGLTGGYDFTLRYEPTNASRPIINGQMQAMSDDEAAESIPFVAVQEQLGLKLAPAKKMVEGLVVDRVERPSEN
jgi:uncharacterized protein (TIGR03435 family)